MTNPVRIRFLTDHFERLTNVSDTTWPKGGVFAVSPDDAARYVDAGVAERVDPPAPQIPPKPATRRR